MDLILIPATLHISPLEFGALGLPIQERIKRFLRYHLAYGHGAVRPEMIRRDAE